MPPAELRAKPWAWMPHKPTLIVTGGSSGAQSINRAVAGRGAELGAAGIQTLHITGRGKTVQGPTAAR